MTAKDARQIDRNTQKALRRSFASWHRRWVKDHRQTWEEFVYCLSLLRAMGTKWTVMARVLEMDDDNMRVSYSPYIYPDREDIQQYAPNCNADSLLRELKDFAEAIEYWDHELDDMVTRYRESGTSWTSIGSVLGVTRQSAQQRFDRAGPRQRKRRVPCYGIIDSPSPVSKITDPAPRQGAQDERNEG